MDPLRILFVEDLQTDYELAQWHLKKEGIVFNDICVDTKQEFSAALDEFQPDLIISDFSMPAFNGLQALQIVLEKNPEIPFIVLTGSMNEETAVECMRAGAADYVLKEKMHRLPFSVNETLKRCQEHKGKINAEKQLQESEEKFRAMFRNNHAVMMLLDPTNGTIVDVNPAACGYYGFNFEQLVTKNISEINTLSLEEVLEEMQKALSEVRNYFNFQHRLSNGEIRDVEVYSCPIKHMGKTLLYSIVHDVTDRKKAEESLRQKLDELMRFHKLTVDRELKMVELKKEVNELLKELNKAPKYKIME